MEKINSVVCVLQSEIKKMFANQNSFLQSIDVINDKISVLQDISCALNNHSQRIKTLEENKIILEASVRDIASRMDSFEQSTLANSLEITGIPYSKFWKVKIFRVWF